MKALLLTTLFSASLIGSAAYAKDGVKQTAHCVVTRLTPSRLDILRPSYSMDIKCQENLKDLFGELTPFRDPHLAIAVASINDVTTEFLTDSLENKTTLAIRFDATYGGFIDVINGQSALSAPVETPVLNPGDTLNLKREPLVKVMIENNLQGVTPTGFSFRVEQGVFKLTAPVKKVDPELYLDPNYGTVAMTGSLAKLIIEQLIEKAPNQFVTGSRLSGYGTKKMFHTQTINMGNSSCTKTWVNTEIEKAGFSCHIFEVATKN